MIALCVFFWHGLKVGDPGSISPILWPDAPYNRAMSAIQSEFGAIEQFVVVAELDKQDALNDPKLYHVMDEYERYMSLDPSVGPHLLGGRFARHQRRGVARVSAQVGSVADHQAPDWSADRRIAGGRVAAVDRIHSDPAA